MNFRQLPRIKRFPKPKIAHSPFEIGEKGHEAQTRRIRTSEETRKPGVIPIVGPDSPVLSCLSQCLGRGDSLMRSAIPHNYLSLVCSSTTVLYTHSNNFFLQLNKWKDN